MHMKKGAYLYGYRQYYRVCEKAFGLIYVTERDAIDGWSVYLFGTYSIDIWNSISQVYCCYYYGEYCNLLCNICKYLISKVDFSFLLPKIFVFRDFFLIFSLLFLMLAYWIIEVGIPEKSTQIAYSISLGIAWILAVLLIFAFKIINIKRGVYKRLNSGKVSPGLAIASSGGRFSEFPWRSWLPSG